MSVEVCANFSGTTNLTITLATADNDDSGEGMATTRALSGQDYQSTSANLTFLAGSDTAQCITITIIDDNIRERDENFMVILTTSDPGVIVGNNLTIVTITDNNDAMLMLEIIPSKFPSVLLGDYISLNCTVSAMLPEDITFTWTHVNSSRTLEETSSVLTLPHITTEQLGTYRCDIAMLLVDQAELTITGNRSVIQQGSYAGRTTSVDACPSSTQRDEISVDVLQLLSSQYGVRPLGLHPSYPAQTCTQISEANPSSTNGLYWIQEDGEQFPTQRTCRFS